MPTQNQNQVQVVEKNGRLALRNTALGLALTGAGISAANAAPIDTTAVVATITDGVTTVSAIGLAVLSLVVVIKVFKWARSAM